ncbi:MAG: hypothetical protein K8H88_32875 [Sandaracinaceae bacterium]|nr:hypothetical protein [Sandaracinaceae bacterium]
MQQREETRASEDDLFAGLREMSESDARRVFPEWAEERTERLDVRSMRGFDLRLELTGDRLA